VTLDDLKDKKGFFYLATPYSLYPQGHEAAWRDACALSARLIRAGLTVF
jgi:hypothetical protein